MKYLWYSLSFLFCFNLNAQQSVDNELNYINYMTNPNGDKVIGSGESIEHIRKMDVDFDEIIVGNGMQLFIVPNDGQDLKILAQENILPLIHSEVIDNKLIVRLSASLETTKGIKLYVPIGKLSKINVKEGGYLNFPEQIKVDKLDLLLQSGSISDCHVMAKNFSCIVMGGSELNLAGKVSELADFFVKGGSVLKGKKFESTNCDMTVLGASKCKLKVTDLLNARVENQSTFVYSGKPKIGKKTTKLNGKIKRRG